jgi:hypothetical protein
MARKASSKPDSGSSSTAIIGFEKSLDGLGNRISDIVISACVMHHFIHHPAPQGMNIFGCFVSCLDDTSIH